MKNNKFIKTTANLMIIITSLLIAACTPDPPAPYTYNTHPTFTKGRIEFYGSYYGNYNYTNNVISITLFSDSIIEDQSGSILGIGQELIIEDLSILPTDTIIPAGTYTVSKTKELQTFVPGRIISANNETETVGSRINYFEKISKKSITGLITDGSIELSYSDTTTNIICNLMTDNKLQIKGSFKGKLKFMNKSILTPKIALLTSL
jgi:hypothetical protein